MFPINTFTIHNLLGLMITGSLAATFYLIYLSMGRRLLDLLAANFIALAAVICLTSFLSDNVVRAGQPSGGAAEAQVTLLCQRVQWAAAVLLAAELHFALCYCGIDRFPRRWMRAVYVLAGALAVAVWSDSWLSVRQEPLAPTSSWQVAIPWMPELGWPVVPFVAMWFALQAYVVVLLWRNRSAWPTLDESSRQWPLVFAAFTAQIVISLLAVVSAGLVRWGGKAQTKAA